MNPDYKIRQGEPKDFEAVIDMIKELALFEKAPEQVINTVERMHEEQDLFGLLVVEHKGEVVAMALYFYAYFTWVGKSMYLDDLYVKEAHRGQGIGQALIDEIFEIAKKENCCRVRWQVLDWNQPAIDLYGKIGANLDKEWINCDFDREAILNY